MIRMIRTATLRALREDIAEAEQAADVYSAEAEKWNAHYVAEVQRADDAEQAIGQTAELRVEDCEQYEQQLSALREQLADAVAERDQARAEADQWHRAYCTEVKVANAAEAAAGRRPTAVHVTENKEVGQ